MESEQIQMEIKEVSGEGTFEGMLSPYGIVDQGNDIVEAGAYTKTLNEHGLRVPLLWQHDSKNPIGDLMLDDRPEGLWAKGRLLMTLPQAKAAYECIKAGIVRGLSIGFKSIKEDYKGNVRYLKEIKLFEGSVVTFPMQDLAQIHSVKAKKRTKRVDGVDLPARSFAYVGDPEKTDTWKLPINFPGDEEKTKSHIRNALSRFKQTMGIPASERAGVLAKIQAAAKRYGIGEKALEGKDFNDALIRTQTIAKFWQMMEALRSSLYDAASDSELTRDEKINSAEDSVSQFSSEFLDFFPDYLDAIEAMGMANEYYSLDDIRTQELTALLARKAGAATRRPGAATDEPIPDHSELEGVAEMLGGIRSLIPN